MKSVKSISKEVSTEILQETHQTTLKNICSMQNCNKPAHCNEHGCWRQRTNNIELDCENCEERLCQRHWRRLVDSI
ncbi:MAG: hypothetical protein ACFFBD_27515 [Candidatus Hodarchaeota archaeon]